MFWKFLADIAVAAFPPLANVVDTRPEHRVRCPGCFTVSGKKMDAPTSSEETNRIIDCEKCGAEIPIVIPQALDKCGRVP